MLDPIGMAGVATLLTALILRGDLREAPSLRWFRRMTRLLDPVLVTGVAMLVIGEWCEDRISDLTRPTHPAPSWLLAIDWITGPGGLLLTFGGSIRIVVRLALARSFLAAVVVFLVFWVPMTLPLIAISVQGGDPAPAGALWFVLLALLFPAMSVTTIISYAAASYVAARRQPSATDALWLKRSGSFGLGILFLGIAEMAWWYLVAPVTWGGPAALNWERKVVIPLWLTPLLVVQTAASGSVGFAAGLWIAHLARRMPRTRFLGWAALGLGAAFFHSFMKAFTALELQERAGEIFLAVMALGVPAGAAAMGVAFVLVGTRTTPRTSERRCPMQP